MSEHDPVNHPKHYTDGKYECIDFIESWGLGFHLGNAVKYITRAGKKEPEKTKEDLEKALWYLERFLKYNHNISGNASLDPISPIDYCRDKWLAPELTSVVNWITMGGFDGIKQAAYLLKLHIGEE